MMRIPSSLKNRANAGKPAPDLFRTRRIPNSLAKEIHLERLADDAHIRALDRKNNNPEAGVARMLGAKTDKPTAAAKPIGANVKLSPEIISRVIGPQAPKLRPPCQVLAIDPGCTHSAYVLYETGTRTIVHFDKVANDHFLEDLRIGLLGYNEAAIEMVAGYGMPVGKEVFETVFWIGRFFEAIRLTVGITTDRMYRKEIKIHLCGTTKAKDSHVRQALIDMFGPSKAEAIGVKAKPGKLYGITKDCWAALALAVAWAGTPIPPAPDTADLFAAGGKK